MKTKVNRVVKSCKKHGETIHGIYKYEAPNGKSYYMTCCLECTRERRAKRYENPIKRLHDIKYTKKWSKENPDLLLKYEKTQTKKDKIRKLSRDAEVRIFLKNNYNNIQNLLLKVNSNISIRQLKKRCLRLHITSFDVIKNFILLNKRSELMCMEEWKQSTIEKYNYFNKLSDIQKAEINEEFSKIKNSKKFSEKELWSSYSSIRSKYYNKLNDFQQKEIRAEYHRKAIEIVNKKMNEIYELI